ncbi:DUF4160 domain-containing protein [Tistrella mobilis]
MATVLRVTGFRVVIYVDDHAPAHVHVYGDGHAKINLIGSEGRPALIWAEDMKQSDVRRAMTIVTEYQAHLLAHWRAIHG